MIGYSWGKPSVGINVDRLSRGQAYVIEYDGLISKDNMDRIQGYLDNTGYKFIVLQIGMKLSGTHRSCCAGRYLTPYTSKLNK